MAEFDYSEAISEARAKYESISKALDVDRLTAEAKDLEVKAAEPGLWDDPENAQKVTSKLSAVQSQLKRLASADQRIEDVETLVELGQEEEDADTLAEAKAEVESIQKDLDDMEIQTLLDGEYDERSAVVTIRSGAGGVDANITFKYKAEPTPARNYRAVKLVVKGLKGGHSGIQIVEQRANANKLLFRFIREQKKSMDILLCSVDGGGLRNAIPREATATLMVRTKDLEQLTKELKAYEKVVKAEFAGIEDAVSIKLTETETPETMIAKEVAENLIRAVVGCPNGVQKMSVSMPGLVQTSSNLARVVSDGKTVKLQCLLRSSVNSEKEELGEAISAVFELAGAKVELTGAYNGWKPNLDSPILAAMKASYKALFGKEPAVTAIHAGLECGIIGTNYPKLDMISFGPTICYPHSPDEKVNIASVGKFYEFLVDTLKNAPLK